MKIYLDAYASYYDSYISLSKYLDCKDHVFESMKGKLDELDNY
jgi:hypothetical protein